MCVHSYAEPVTFYVIHLKGCIDINTVIITGFSCSPVELYTTNTAPPATIHPVIRLHSKHNVSSGCFGAVCLDNEMQGKQTITLLVGSRQTLLCERETVQVFPVPLH